MIAGASVTGSGPGVDAHDGLAVAVTGSSVGVQDGLVMGLCVESYGFAGAFVIGFDVGRAEVYFGFGLGCFAGTSGWLDFGVA